ncbi:hypothetical protein Rhopal_007881-T1 [Rhodotorula paludigena]|uniref:MIT domain-containing protein n=1 Tax=Rhodotorula paludigena TaxID=86838 RepID=A0AAV5GZZ3_9BASI|nr:hypothetical protein Rhopal_007881-T1 [Rhodotorula paludigena]
MHPYAQPTQPQPPREPRIALASIPPSPPRQRGQSSPAVEHQPHEPPGARPPAMRRQSSGGGSASVTRRTVVGDDGVERDETREERRTRKARERTERAMQGLSIASDRQDSPTQERRRLSSRTSRTSDADFNAAALGSPPIPSPSSSAHIATSSSSSSSKSVLTIALQRAQSAVLLDSANNFPAAVAAYTQSVRLLREVMARVEENSRDMERKLSTGGIREGESGDEYERRKARYERKERAKQDEARRLRVIHDTYEDRIRMLVQMGHPLPPNATLPALPAAPLPVATATGDLTTSISNPTLPSSFDGTLPDSPHLPSASASTPSVTTPGPPLTMQYRRHRADHERSASAASADEAAGIGEAMLLASPTSTEGHDVRGMPQIAALPVVSQHEDVETSTYHDADATLLALPDESSRPHSYASDSTATARARTPNTATPTPTATPGPHPYAGLPAPITPSPADLAAALGRPGPMPAPLLDDPAPRRPSLASHDMRRGSSASALTQMSAASGETLRIGFGSSQGSPALGSESMRRFASSSSAASASAGAAMMRRGSSFGGLGTVEAAHAPVEIRPRPARGASLVGSAAMGLTNSRDGLVNASTAEGTIRQRRHLRSPQPGEQPGPSTRPSSELDPEGARIVVRAPSSDVERVGPAPAEQPAPAAKSGFSAASLPGRLRALSQPGSKRPKLQSFDSDSSARPPLPPLLASPQQPQQPRSVSTSHHPSASTSSASLSTAQTGFSVMRKSSVPTPTSLNAPQFAQLGRSNSSSSIGSNGSYRYGHPNGGGSPGETPASATFPHTHTSTSPFTSSSPLPPLPHHASHAAHQSVYLSAGLPSPPPTTGAASSRDTILSIPSVRRPFHLMRLVVATIPSSPTTSHGGGGGGGGGYLSEKLFVPAQVWTTQGGAKLVALETKVRMLDLLSSGLDALDKAGRGMLLVPTGSTSAPRVARDEAARFVRELDSFEGLAEGIQSTLGKKLGQGVIGTTGGGIAGGTSGSFGNERDPKSGRKGSTASFSAWSSKLSMSLNRVVANGASLDSQATYVDAIAKIFRQAQRLDQHLALVFPTQFDDTNALDSAYALLSPADRHRLERHLRKASEFFGQVICRFVMRDVDVKRGGAWLSGE